MNLAPPFDDVTLESLRRRATVTPRGCWVGVGSDIGHGYHQLHRRRGDRRWVQYVHRLAYQLAHGPIPEGYEVDHLCRVPACCNPEHLEAVTPEENKRRVQKRTHCSRGHELTEDNVYRRKTHRECKTCRRIHMREFRQRRAS